MIEAPGQDQPGERPEIPQHVSDLVVCYEMDVMAASTPEHHQALGATLDRIAAGDRQTAAAAVHCMAGYRDNPLVRMHASALAGRFLSRAAQDNEGPRPLDTLLSIEEALYDLAEDENPNVAGAVVGMAMNYVTAAGDDDLERQFRFAMLADFFPEGQQLGDIL